MLTKVRWVMLLMALVVLAACGALDDTVRVAGNVADETGRLAGNVGDDVLRTAPAVGDDAARLAARLATHDEIARMAASQATIFTWQVEQRTPGGLTAERRAQLQAGLEKAVCLYMKRSTLAGQADVEQRVAEIAVQVSVPYEDLLNGAVSAAQSIRQGLTDHQEFVNAIELYCRARAKLR